MSEKYGFVDVDRSVVWRSEGKQVRVLVNGEDMTKRCREADDTKGTALLYKWRDGKPYLDPDTHDVAMVRVENATVEILLDEMKESA